MSRKRQWMRARSRMVDDPRMLSISKADRWHFIALMCCKWQGTLDRGHSQDLVVRLLSAKLGIKVEEVHDLGGRLAAVGLLVPGTFEATESAKGELLGPYSTERPDSNIWRALREFVFKRDNYTCQYCGERGQKLECDHVVPVVRGGGHEHANLVTACFACNRSKRDKLVEEWLR